MATSSTCLLDCSICEQRDDKKPSISWCPECEEALCSSCKQHHAIAKASRNHTTISKDDYQKLPKFILNIELSCKEHDEKFLNYCLDHEQPLCKKCIASSHQKCQNTPVLDDVIKNVKTSVMFDRIDESLKAFLQKIRVLVEDREKNAEKLQNQKKDISSKIQQMKEKINTHLDKLEKDMVLEISKAEENCQKSILCILGELNEKESRLLRLQEEYNAVKLYASNFQTFIGLKELETIWQIEGKYMCSLNDDERLDNIYLCCNFDQKLNDLISDIPKFGSIETKTSPKTISLQSNAAGAQVITPTGKPVKLQFKEQIDLQIAYTGGCCVLPNKDIVFSDFHTEQSGLILYKQDGPCQTKMLKGDPTSAIACIDANHIAISTAFQKQIFLVNTSNYQKTQTFETRSVVGGLSLRKGVIIFAARGEGLKGVIMADKTISNLHDDTSVSKNTHIASNDHRVCYTCPEASKVIVLNQDFIPLFEFTDKILKNPQGIAIDEIMNIYVAGFATNNLIVISPNGQNCHQLLEKEVGLRSPTVVSYDRNTRVLVVCNMSKLAFVYKIN